jgi:hypothetical protein
MALPVVTTYTPPVHTVGLPDDEVINALAAGVVDIKRYVEIYESDGVTPMDIEDFDGRLNQGSITVDMTRDERRMCEMTLINDDFALNEDPDGGFWYDKIIKAYWGIEYDDAYGQPKRWEMQVGEFMIDRIDQDRYPYLVKITGRDYTKKCLVSQILNSIQFDPSTPVENIIRALAANAGVTKFRLPYTGLAFTESVVFDPGTPRWEVMKRIADSVGHEIYFTPDGHLTMRPYQDPSTSPITWAFVQGREAGTLVKYSKSSEDTLLKNHCVVIGAPSTSNTGLSQVAFGEARNDDPQSPTRIERMGDRVDIFKSQYITESSQAQALAEARLKILGLEQYNVQFESIIIPFVDAGDIILVATDNESEFTPVRFLFANYTLPLGLGVMSGSARRVTLVGTKSRFGVY